MAKPESRTVGKSEAPTGPPPSAPVPGGTPQGGTDNPTTRQPDNGTDNGEKSKKKDEPSARVAAPLLLLGVVTVAAGGVLAVHEWGWWGLAAALGAAAVLAVAALAWGRSAKRRTSRRSSGGATGGRAGSSRRGLLSRLTGRSGGTGGGRSRGGLLSRLGMPGLGGRGRGGRSGAGRGGRASRAGRGTGRSRGSVLGKGRGPKLGRGGALLSTGSGPNLGGLLGGKSRKRGGGWFRHGRRGRARRTPGMSERWRRGGEMLTAASVGLNRAGAAVKTADDAVGKAAGRGWFATADAVTDAIDTILPAGFRSLFGSHHQGDNTMTNNTQRSQFEKLTETLPQLAFTDPIGDHDLGIAPMVQSMEAGFDSIATYVDNVRARIESENYVGSDPLVQDAMQAITRMVRACGPVTDEVHKILKMSPQQQDLERRVNHANGSKSDIEAARRAGLI